MIPLSNRNNSVIMNLKIKILMTSLQFHYDVIIAKNLDFLVLWDVLFDAIIEKTWFSKPAIIFLFKSEECTSSRTSEES